MRISNFLLWQIAYAELYITETLWPDFSRTDLLQAVLEYQKRDRRYGGLSGAPVDAPVNGAAKPARPEPARSAASGMKRLLTAAALIPIVVYVVLFANFWVFLAVLIAVAVLCYHEYNGIAAAYGFGAPGPLGYGFGLLLLVWEGDAWALAVAAALVALAMAMRERDLANALPRAALLLLGVVYVFGCWKCALPLRQSNPHWLMYALVLNWAGDAGAYYVGRAFGAHKMAPRVSPKKSWEGAAASVAVSTPSPARTWRTSPASPFRKPSPSPRRPTRPGSLATSPNPP